MNRFGFVRVTACSPVVTVGNPAKNAEAINNMTGQHMNSDVIIFPELSITGYTCGDLFRQKQLLNSSEEAVRDILKKNWNRTIIVGAPVPVGNELFNCAIIIHCNSILGIVPKQNIPNYNEFYESRWFRRANGQEAKVIDYADCRVPFGIDLLFKARCYINKVEFTLGVEICEDLWMPIPPSSHLALAGANILVNLSASNETVAKNEYRQQLVANQSGRCVAAYIYASAGPSESTTDLVFGGHCLIAENGNMLAESSRVGDGELSLGERSVTTDVDVEKLQTERRLLTSFGDAAGNVSEKYRTIPMDCLCENKGNETMVRKFNGTPFIPKDQDTLHFRCAEIFGIQCAGLAKRLQHTGVSKVYIGVSGGLDSTLALLVAAKTFKMLGLERSNICGITMPGFGTTKQTKNNALSLMRALGISSETIDIRQACMETFNSINHKPFGVDCKRDLDNFEGWLRDVPKEKRNDLVFENVQARMRTMLLFSKGFVLGTGDLSEAALGWCTYNGDHMSAYNVNCSIPKTLVKWLVKYVADTESEELEKKNSVTALQVLLHDIVNTIISPELLPPGADGEIVHSTEDLIGPYELHDFYLANFVRNGFSPEKLLFLAKHAEFTVDYPHELKVKTLKTFLTRFFANQFKRSCVPDGPKVGSVSLSPRGDWRMPSDADVAAWLEKVQ